MNKVKFTFGFEPATIVKKLLITIDKKQIISQSSHLYT